MLEPNTVIGDRYKIISLIARGGMGYVYLAEAENNPEFKVALKVLDPEKIESPEEREIFRQEVTAAYRVSHPNVVTVYESFDTPDIQAYALEYLPGGDLFERQTGEQLPVKDVLSWLKQAASGLHALHRSGTIHRDIKPENLLFDHDGTIKITDFGVAVVKGQKRREKKGVLAGTQKYLSPEYVEYGNFDQRSDIYALGVMAYELFSGRSPFISPEGDELLKERLSDKVGDLGELVPGLNPEILALVQKMMAKNPQERFYDGKEVVRAISKIEETLGFLEVKSNPVVRASFLQSLECTSKNQIAEERHLTDEARSFTMKRVSSLELVVAGLLAALVLAIAFPLIFGGN